MGDIVPNHPYVHLLFRSRAKHVDERPEHQSAGLYQSRPTKNRCIQFVDRPIRIDIFGHADQTGDESFNISISHSRAKVFAGLLIGLGMAPSFVTAHAAGSREHVNPSVDEASRARDRRVIFKISQVSTPKPPHFTHP